MRAVLVDLVLWMAVRIARVLLHRQPGAARTAVEWKLIDDLRLFTGARRQRTEESHE